MPIGVLFVWSPICEFCFAGAVFRHPDVYPRFSDHDVEFQQVLLHSIFTIFDLYVCVCVCVLRSWGNVVAFDGSWQGSRAKHLRVDQDVYGAAQEAGEGHHRDPLFSTQQHRPSTPQSDETSFSRCHLKTEFSAFAGA